MYQEKYKYSCGCEITRHFASTHMHLSRSQILDRPVETVVAITPHCDYIKQGFRHRCAHCRLLPDPPNRPNRPTLPNLPKTPKRPDFSEPPRPAPSPPKIQHRGSWSSISDANTMYDLSAQSTNQTLYDEKAPISYTASFLTTSTKRSRARGFRRLFQAFRKWCSRDNDDVQEIVTKRSVPRFRKKRRQKWNTFINRNESDESMVCSTSARIES